MKSKNPITLLIGWLTLALISDPAAHAADNNPAANVSIPQTGNVAGRITNAATGTPLEGARVEIEGRDLVAVTDREGVYTFARLPAGSVTLRISYTGLNPVEATVQIDPAQPVRRDVALTADIYTLSKFVVSGEREGNAEAIMLQRHSDGVKNIAATDAFGTLASNPADLLQRLPGIEAESVGGDRRYVRIRGLHQDLATTTMDGNRVAAAGGAGTNRGYEFQPVGADTIQRIEVVKSPTPDMDGDSIGGAVNMVSKSAFDGSGERRVSGSIGLIWRALDDRDEPRRHWSVSYSEVFGGKLGVAVNYAQRAHGSMQDVTTMAYQQLANGVAGPAYTYSFQTFDFRNVRTGWGGGLKLDYKLDDHTRFYVNATGNKYLEFANHVRATYSTAQTVATRDAAGNLTGTNAILPEYTDRVTEWRPVTTSIVTNTATIEHRRNQVFHAQFGGVHRFEGLDIDWDAYESKSKSEYPGNKTFDLIARGVGMRIEKTDQPYYPNIMQTSGPDLTKIASYTENLYSIFRQSGWDKYLGAQLAVKKQLDTVVPTYIKTGVRWRRQNRDNEATPYRGNYVGADGVMGVNPATGLNDDNLAQFVDPTYHNPDTSIARYPVPPYPTKPGRDKPGSSYGYTGFNIDTVLRNTPQLMKEDIPTDMMANLVGNTHFTESITAAYIMGNVQLGKLGILGGVRVESTEVEGEGALQIITAEEAARRAAWVGPVTDEENRRRAIAQYGGRVKREGEYRTVFPGLHFKYEPFRGLLTRLSYATNIGRPSIGQLIPRTTADDKTMTVSSSNPSLKPQSANNFDLTGEYYFEPAGLISAGLFLKEIKQFIYTQGGAIVPAGDDNGFSGQYAGYTLTTQRNGGFAKIKGFEFNYLQQFTFLPGWWSGFGAFANYTRMSVEGNYGSGNAIALAPTSEVAGFNPKSGNVGISYIRNRVTVRLQLNYYGRYLSSFNVNQSLLTYHRPRTKVDVRTKYQISKNIDAYLDVVNVFDAPDRWTERYGGRPVQIQTIGPQFFFGINGRL